MANNLGWSHTSKELRLIADMLDVLNRVGGSDFCCEKLDFYSYELFMGTFEFLEDGEDSSWDYVPAMAE